MDYKAATPPRKRNLLDYLAFTFILCLVIIYRYQLLYHFSFVYTDSDQTIMWEALSNYSAGAFHEPRFYGQTYNTFLEALLAVPLYRCGIPAYKALPIVSTFLTIFPFALLSFFTLLRRSVLHGLIILSIPLMLPHEYGMITAMPRGFVTGIFFAAIGCLSVLFPRSKASFALAGLSAALAYIANSNAMLLSVVCFFYLFLHNFNNPKFYFYAIAGILPGAVLLWIMNRFYVLHPYYDLHKLNLGYHSETFIKSLSKLPEFFGYNTPVMNHNGVAIFIILVLIALYFAMKRSYIKAAAVAFILPMLILTFGLGKLHEATDSLYFHYSRMFLAVPFLIAFCLMLFEPVYEPPFFYTWCIAANYYFNMRINGLAGDVEKIATKNAVEIVISTPVEYILKGCRDLNKIAKENNVELVVMVNHFFNDCFTYGCPSCSDSFPEIIRPAYDRRTWKLLETENKIYKTVLLVDEEQNIKSTTLQVKKIPSQPKLFLVTNNTLKTMVLLDSLKVKYRRFR